MGERRYVTASESCKVLAIGTAFLAALQDMTLNSPMRTETQRRWDSWCKEHPNLKPLAEQFQKEMFDRVLAMD